MAIVSLFYPSLYHPVSLLLFSSLTFQCIEELRCSTDGKEHNNTSLPAELPAPTAVRGEALRQRPPHGQGHHRPPHSTTHEGPGPPRPPPSLPLTDGHLGLHRTQSHQPGDISTSRVNKKQVCFCLGSAYNYTVHFSISVI